MELESTQFGILNHSKKIPHRFPLGSIWSLKFTVLTNKNLLSYSDFSVSCASYITTLLTIDNGHFLFAKFRDK